MNAPSEVDDAALWFEADDAGTVVRVGAAAAALGLMPGQGVSPAALRLQAACEALTVSELTAFDGGAPCWRYQPAERLLPGRSEGALQTARQRLQAETRLRRLLERQLISVAEREQRRMSLELHDGLGQQLSGLAFTAASLAANLKDSGQPQAEGVAWLARLLRDAVGRVRALSRGLWPASLEKQSLPQALSALAQDIQQLYGIRMEVQAGDFVADSGHAAHHLYRVVQEAVNNAVKHGQARHVAVRLEELPGQCMLTVVSDGRPVDHKAIAQSTGLGLLGMRLRAQALGGEVSVEPLSSGGAEVCLTWRPGRSVRRPQAAAPVEAA